MRTEPLYTKADIPNMEKSLARMLGADCGMTQLHDFIMGGDFSDETKTKVAEYCEELRKNRLACYTEIYNELQAVKSRIATEDHTNDRSQTSH